MSTLTAAYIDSPSELRPNATEDDLQGVIRAAYRQVLGNVHVMDSQRLTSAESMLRNGDITVKEFIRRIAQSDLYQSLFFSNKSPYRSIELNCKHLLGRAPLDQAEISQHVQTYNEQGYETDIDSYIDSAEYADNFGDNTVPYPRSIRSQTGIKNVVYNRTLSLLGGYATSDNSKEAQLINTVAANIPQKIKVASSGKGSTYTNTSKRFRLTILNLGLANARTKTTTVEIGYSQLSQKIQNVQRGGGKILSITEVN
ncbi:photosystem I reaction center subunit XII [Aphanothece hegewaldii CCALA 016]|uniref:Photosystem I reaction center subunit XII n=1 Tax=Aphanothece hegewaldii CCALA 016 TaxID=2107694 RepID=A0A2T1LXP5_9CHRO|nr:phycobilisome rod-core linker polypeptide [Aphanothece hegewaldii]PSF37155.1 photosystem I reaction center subunit XII [Aphanothece hegewaldii CCALA 016]